MKPDYSNLITFLTEQIKNDSSNSLLYYERGYYYFLTDQDESAKNDYKTALDLGLDFSKYPYYSFSNSNEKRRNFLLPEKILVFLILILIIVSIIFEVFSFINKYLF